MSDSTASTFSAMTLLRVAVLASSLGLAGYLVVQAQRNAAPVPEVAPDPAPTSALTSEEVVKPLNGVITGNSFPALEEGANRSFLYSSKILQTSEATSLSELVNFDDVLQGTSQSVETRSSGLPSEDSEESEGGNLQAKNAPATRGTFLPSSKSVTIVLPLVEQPRTTVTSGPAKTDAKGETLDKAKAQTAKGKQDD